MSDEERVVVRGTRRAMKELVDGTIRVQIDIDPPFRKDFLALFSEIDMPIALAPLQEPTGTVPGKNLSVENKRSRGGAGPNRMLAEQWCSSHEFQKWVTKKSGGNCAQTVPGAHSFIYATCRVASLRELDTNKDGEGLWNRQIKQPYLKHLKPSTPTIPTP